MPLKNRQTLKNYFHTGSLPTEGAFEDLIDSLLNKIDDGFSKDDENGLLLAPAEGSTAVLSFIESMKEQNAEWQIKLLPQTNAQPSGLLFEGPSESALFFLDDSGKFGIGTKKPNHQLDVNGKVAARGFIGSYSEQTEVPADGKWHEVISGLDGAQAFEIIARAGVADSGKHALLHATALSTFGKSMSKIKCAHVRFSFWRPLKITARWRGTTHDFSLELKTTRNLGENAMIKYQIKELWNDLTMALDDQYKAPEAQSEE